MRGNNKITIDESEMNRFSEIQKLALLGFLLGRDNYGEDVIGVSNELIYHKMRKHYSMTVFLRETPTHTSTSGIGFYLKSNNRIMVYSSGEVITVGITRDIQDELDKALVSTI